MILAGIDEAGYGPLLGPLVVGCCAFEAPDQDENSLPDLWKHLRKVVSKTRSRTGKKLHINDSKQVYSPSGGLKELERAILCLFAATGGSYEDFNAFLCGVASHVIPDLADHAWYQPPADERFPLEQNSTSIGIFANALRLEMRQKGLHCTHLSARVMLERQLNRQFQATRNKSSTLFSAAAIHIDHLLRTHGHQNLTIFCDRQGGREHYGPLLRLMFEDWSLEVVREQEGDCEYRLHRQPNPHAAGAAPPVRLIFCQKAEAQCLPTAVASMLCKYLREALMRRFNAWWQTHLPTLTPTAGYYNDGLRFLQETADLRRRLAIPDHHLIRSR